MSASSASRTRGWPALAGLYDSARIVPATVRFVDIAGLVRGASQGQGLGNQFLAHIRETDAICQVVRVFTDPDVTHVDGDVVAGARHRDDRYRADPGRPADPGEGRAAAGQGSEVRQEPGTASAAADAGGKAQPVLDGGTHAVRGRGGGRDRPG